MTLTIRPVFAFALFTLGPVPPAFASGNEHVVDDAAVETPGTCHLESWMTFHGSDRGLLNLSPACTRKAWPRLEIGGAFQSSWDGGADLTTFGPALKLNIRPVEKGFGVGLIASGAVELRSGKVETASLIVPVTIPVGKAVRFNLNGGWSYARASSQQHAAFYGAQVEVQVARDFSLMGEVFGRGDGPIGSQAGVRWNPGGGRLDVDLVVGRRIDGVNPRSVSFGITLRS